LGPVSLFWQAQTISTMIPMIVSAMSTHHPVLPMSCRRRMPTAKLGRKQIRPKIVLSGEAKSLSEKMA
jgi:hypothetical protein